MLTPVVQTHTHAKRQTNPLKIWRCIIESTLSASPAIVRNASVLNLLKFCVYLLVRVLSNIQFNTDPLDFCIRAFRNWRLSKQRWYIHSVVVNDPLHEQEIFLLQPCCNFASPHPPHCDIKSITQITNSACINKCISCSLFLSFFLFFLLPTFPLRAF